MRFDILTLFPDMFRGPFDDSIIKRARESGLISIHLHNIRDFATDKHHITDDYPYGGGGGMVMKPEPVFACVEHVLTEPSPGEEPPPTILLTPQGRLFTHQVAMELARHARLILICGRYEGVDERVCEHLITDEISIGDYVLSGGEIAAMVIVDAVTRLLPGALGYALAPLQDSHATGLLEGPQYTRPAEFRGWRVPDILLSGHHGEVARWHRQQALRRTLERRPDLLARARLTAEDRRFLASLGYHGPFAPEDEMEGEG
jgi:tRNA (guanine37-N1)-methyltransferase